MSQGNQELPNGPSNSTDIAKYNEEKSKKGHWNWNPLRFLRSFMPESDAHIEEQIRAELLRIQREAEWKIQLKKKETSETIKRIQFETAEEIKQLEMDVAQEARELVQERSNPISQRQNPEIRNFVLRYDK